MIKYWGIMIQSWHEFHVKEMRWTKKKHGCLTLKWRVGGPTKKKKSGPIAFVSYSQNLGRIFIIYPIKKNCNRIVKWRQKIYRGWFDFADAIFFGFRPDFCYVSQWILKLLRIRVISRCRWRRPKFKLGRHFSRVAHTTKTISKVNKLGLSVNQKLSERVGKHMKGQPQNTARHYAIT